MSTKITLYILGGGPFLGSQIHRYEYSLQVYSLSFYCFDTSVPVSIFISEKIPHFFFSRDVGVPDSKPTLF